MKTSEWAVSAFGSCNRAHAFSIKASVGQFAFANFSVSADSEFDIPMVNRSGPKRPTSHAPIAGSPGPISLPSDQCLFLRYYVVVNRLLGRRLVQELPKRRRPEQGYLAAMCCLPLSFLSVPSMFKRTMTRRRSKKSADLEPGAVLDANRDAIELVMGPSHSHAEAGTRLSVEASRCDAEALHCDEDCVSVPIPSEARD